MKMTDLRAKARAIFGPAIAEPMPKQPNGAKALQERANARPIPTYKVGGAVKKNTPPQPTAAEREADRKRREEYAKMKVTPENAAAIGRGNRSSGYKNGGRPTPGTAPKKPKTPMTSDELERRYDKLRQKDLNAASMTGKPTGYSSNMKTGGKVQTSADTAKKLATEMGGMKKGGKAKKDGLAVMIAIGEPKKPVKKMGGGMAYADGGKPVKKAAGGAAKVRKGMMTPEGKITHAMNKLRGK
jgi:hypothetical protein